MYSFSIPIEIFFYLWNRFLDFSDSNIEPAAPSQPLLLLFGVFSHAQNPRQSTQKILIVSTFCIESTGRNDQTDGYYPTAPTTLNPAHLGKHIKRLMNSICTPTTVLWCALTPTVPAMALISTIYGIFHPFEYARVRPTFPTFLPVASALTPTAIPVTASILMIYGIFHQFEYARVRPTFPTFLLAASRLAISIIQSSVLHLANHLILNKPP